MAPPVAGVFDPAVGKKQQQEARKYCEDALESFLSRLPAWRGGHRDAGRYMTEDDSGKNGSRRSPGRGAESSSRSRSRSRSRRRRDKDKDKDKRHKDKKRDRKDRRDRSRSQEAVVVTPAAPVKSGPNFTSEPGAVPQPSALAALPSSLPPSMPGAPPAGAGGASVPDWLSDIVPKGPGLPVGTGIRGPAHREVLVPQQYVSRLIGRGGETIMGICHQTGADVKIRQETKELGYSLAVITGRPEMVDVAERMVMEKLALVGGRLAGTPVVAPVSF